MQLCMPKIHCRVFEDNNGAIELAKCEIYWPCTKHINIKYWHFMEYVMRYNTEILPIDTKDQLADIFTKPLPQETFERLRDKVQGIDWKFNTILILKQGSVSLWAKRGCDDSSCTTGQINTAQIIFNAGLKYCCRATKGLVYIFIYSVRSAPTKLHTALSCLYKENNAMTWNDGCRMF